MPKRPLPTWANQLPEFPPPFGSEFPWLARESMPRSGDGPHPEELRLAAVEQAVGYSFRDRRLLRCALTSTGWVNEHQLWWGSRWPDNKALEWLGDAVLYRVVTEHLVASGDAMCTGKSTPNRANLVSNERLAQVGERMGLWDALFLGKGERRNNAAKGRPRFLACAVEAVIGAAYLDANAAGDEAGAVAGELVHRLLLGPPGE